MVILPNKIFDTFDCGKQLPTCLGRTVVIKYQSPSNMGVLVLKNSSELLDADQEISWHDSVSTNYPARNIPYVIKHSLNHPQPLLRSLSFPIMNKTCVPITCRIPNLTTILTVPSFSLCKKLPEWKPNTTATIFRPIIGVLDLILSRNFGSLIHSIYLSLW